MRVGVLYPLAVSALLLATGVQAQTTCANPICTKYTGQGKCNPGKAGAGTNGNASLADFLNANRIVCLKKPDGTYLNREYHNITLTATGGTGSVYEGVTSATGTPLASFTVNDTASTVTYVYANNGGTYTFQFCAATAMPLAGGFNFTISPTNAAVYQPTIYIGSAMCP